MEVVEIAELYKHIKKHFPFFDATLAKVKEDHRYLHDFPADTAWTNINRHIMTETATPGIAHIRGRLGEQMDRQRSKADTAAHFDRLEQWQQEDKPPPEGYWENVKAKLREGSAC
ncbi:hypothetical protein D3C75_722270 [compost metagenome]